ncbi:hypothetical protein [Wukongibacter baidiensis]
MNKGGVLFYRNNANISEENLIRVEGITTKDFDGSRNETLNSILESLDIIKILDGEWKVSDILQLLALDLDKIKLMM